MLSVKKLRPTAILADAVILAVLLLVAVCALYPFLYVIAVSLSSYTAYLNNPIMIFPQDTSFEAYQKILSYKAFGNSYQVTLFVTVVGTGINLLLTCLMAYPLSKRSLRGAKGIMVFVIFSMIFKPALLPKFLAVRSYGLYDTLWALILPTAIDAYNLILMRNFFSSIPASLEESARLDGASELRILRSIILPLSKHAIATIGLFYAVFHWNNFFSGVVYLKSRSNWPVQLLLREVVMENNLESAIGSGASELVDIMPFTIKMAAVVITVLPILVVYPFIQKFFVKGVVLGAVKE